ncbi:nucleotide sugar dehydrogenase [Candidatus Pelagibacter sp.]|nr:nucleotide sugar dehydrogenase [Candidatus Pelagibacter sp.]
MKNYNYKKKILSKKNCISVIGLGYVGLPLSLLLSKKDKVIGIDIDKKKIRTLNSNKSYLERIDNIKIRRFNNKKNIFCSDFSKLKDSNFIIICVPTPLKKDNTPDLSFIKNALIKIQPHLKKGHVVILESTSYPGTTHDHIVKILNKKFKVGEEIFVGFSSERIDPGRNDNNIEKIPKVVSGYSKSCLSVISKFYQKHFTKIFKAETIVIAEFSKLLENIYRSVNIGFVNEMKIIADKMGVDIFKIIQAAKTKPYGFRGYWPGPGVGGHCIPIDPSYLNFAAKKFGYDSRFIKISSDINFKITKFVEKKITSFLSSNDIKFSSAKILLLGLAYKKNIDDYRESASLKLFDLLKKKDIKKIKFYDPHFRKNNIPKKIVLLKKLTSKTLLNFDLVVLITDHDCFDYKSIYKNSKKIIDCRGKFPVSEKVIRG